MKFFKSILSAAFFLCLTFSATAQSMEKNYRTVKVELKIDAPAEKVWQAMVIDYGNIGNFSPYIYSSNYLAGSLKGEKGAQRKCSFNDKGTQWVQERIADIDTKNRVMRNVPFAGAKLPLNFDNSQAFYTVRDNGDGTSTAGYQFDFRTKPAFMGLLAKGGFKKQLAGTLIGLKHYVETGEKVTPMNEKYDDIKDTYENQVIIK